jgi:hypothetical protein
MQDEAKESDAMWLPLRNKLLFDFGQTGKLLNKSRNWVSSKVRTGEIKSVKLGPREAISRREVLRIATEGLREKETAT